MYKGPTITTRILNAATFIILEIAALGILSNAGPLQNLWLMKMSHRFMAYTWGQTEKISQYFNLAEENQTLSLENQKLFEENMHLKNVLESNLAGEFNDSLMVHNDEFMFIQAKIVKVSNNSQHNFFILNKGYEDGIVPQSGVITTSGVVGIINSVDKHYSYGLSLMNTGVNISARLGDEGAIGPLSWDGHSLNKAILKEVPLQHKYDIGDTVWTSGYSSLFPADIPLGLAGGSKIVNGAVNEISVTLFQDFNTLKYVTIIINVDKDEIESLEQAGIQKEDQ